MKPCGRCSNPENFRHRPRRILRMSLINPTLPFFIFAHHHPINKRHTSNAAAPVPRGGSGAWTPVGVHLSMRGSPFLPSFRRVFYEKALREKSNDCGHDHRNFWSEKFLDYENGSTWNNVRIREMRLLTFASLLQCCKFNSIYKSILQATFLSCVFL